MQVHSEPVTRDQSTQTEVALPLPEVKDARPHKEHMKKEHKKVRLHLKSNELLIRVWRSDLVLSQGQGRVTL